MNTQENKNKTDSIYNPLIWESFLGHPSQEEQERDKIKAKKNVEFLKYKIKSASALSLLKEKTRLSLENRWNNNEKLDAEINRIYETIKDSDEIK